jgi:hypothetical protein
MVTVYLGSGVYEGREETVVMRKWWSIRAGNTTAIGKLLSMEIRADAAAKRSIV